MSLNNRSTAFQRELLNRSLFYDTGQVQDHKYNADYAGLTMLHLMAVIEKHFSIYEILIHKLEQFIEELDILSAGHLPITLISPTQLTHVCYNKSWQSYKKQIQEYIPACLYFYYYYGMKLINSWYDKHFKLLLQFPVFIEPYTQNHCLYINQSYMSCTY